MSHHPCDDGLVVEPAQSEKPSRPLEGIHILAIDDDPDARETLKRILMHSGAFVTTMASASAALARLTQINPDVIISDLSMPRHDGHWLMRMVRLIRAGLPIPAIAVTAYRDTEPERKAYEAGFGAYLEKPLDFPRLIATIQKVVGRRAA